MGFMGLFTRSGPKIKVQDSKKDGFNGWIKCSGCTETIHASELKENLNCCPKCDYHYRLTVAQRLRLLTDEDSSKEFYTHLTTSDPLSFVDQEEYPVRTKKAIEKAGRNEAIWTGKAKLDGTDIALAILDFSFMGGSMGSVVGERLTRLIEYALEKGLPLITISSSGGARMQESILSLMQMAKTSAALGKLSEKNIPFISVLTNPTTGGVTASFASLGDVIVAEPGALIGFAGPRVVAEITRQKLPKGAQQSEFLKEKGMIDKVVSRSDLKKTLSFLIRFLKIQESEAKEEFMVTRRLKRFFAYAAGER